MHKSSATQRRENQADQEAVGETGRNASEFARLWLRWTEVFEKSASKGRQSLWMSEDGYRSLQKNLVEELVRLEKADGLVDAERDVYRRMEYLCRPWLSLELLVHTDRRIVRDVGRNGRGLYGELVGDHWPHRRLMTVMLTFVGLAVGGALLAWLLMMHLRGDTQGVTSLLTENARGLWYQVCYRFRQQNYSAWIAVGVALMLAVGLWTLRSMKSF